jgi:nucleotide-binding universal stress UspA family protein
MKMNELKKYLAKEEEQLKDAGLSVRSEVRKGRPAEQIIEYASEKSFNLIVMSTHGRSGLGRWVFGSVASKVLHEASSPILLIRPQ